jgi:hypothetical protein
MKIASPVLQTQNQNQVLGLGFLFTGTSKTVLPIAIYSLGGRASKAALRLLPCPPAARAGRRRKSCATAPGGVRLKREGRNDVHTNDANASRDCDLCQAREAAQEASSRRAVSIQLKVTSIELAT